MQSGLINISACLRMVVVGTGNHEVNSAPGISFLHDPDYAFAKAYGSLHGHAYIIRPDGHIGWRGKHASDSGLNDYLRRLFLPVVQ